VLFLKIEIEAVFDYFLTVFLNFLRKEKIEGAE